MLKAISWDQYFLFIGIALVIWYGYVVLRMLLRAAIVRSGGGVTTFKSADRSALIGEVKPMTAPTARPIIEEATIGEPQPEAETAVPLSTDRQQVIAQAVAEEVREALRNGSDEGISNEEMQARLSVILANYPDLGGSLLGEKISALLLREGENLGYDWSPEEVAAMWT